MSSTIAKSIITQDISPEFKEEDYFKGLKEAVNSLIMKIDNGVEQVVNNNTKKEDIKSYYKPSSSSSNNNSSRRRSTDYTLLYFF